MLVNRIREVVTTTNHRVGTPVTTILRGTIVTARPAGQEETMTTATDARGGIEVPRRRDTVRGVTEALHTTDTERNAAIKIMTGNTTTTKIKREEDETAMTWTAAKTGGTIVTAMTGTGIIDVEEAMTAIDGI